MVREIASFILNGAIIFAFMKIEKFSCKFPWQGTNKLTAYLLYPFKTEAADTGCGEKL